MASACGGVTLTVSPVRPAYQRKNHQPPLGMFERTTLPSMLPAASQ